MNFNDHSNLRGKHAIFSPSSYYWIDDTPEEAVKRYCSSFATTEGTILHSLAEDYIRYNVKMTRFDKKQIPLALLKGGIPAPVVDLLPIDDIFDNIMQYVNDGIGYRMTPEVTLYYSDRFFGTADTAAFNEHERLLRISDLKNGATPAKIDQLVIYDALFRLEYCPLLRIRPEDICSELRIYQRGEIQLCTPDPADVISVMDQIKTFDNQLINLQ